LTVGNTDAGDVAAPQRFRSYRSRLRSAASRTSAAIAPPQSRAIGLLATTRPRSPESSAVALRLLFPSGTEARLRRHETEKQASKSKRVGQTMTARATRVDEGTEQRLAEPKPMIL